MDLAITTLSQNGQVVIPSHIRKEAGLKPATKFLVINEGGTILLKQVTEDIMQIDRALLKKIREAEEQVKKGEVIIADTSMTAEEIADLLEK